MCFVLNSNILILINTVFLCSGNENVRQSTVKNLIKNTKAITDLNPNESIQKDSSSDEKYLNITELTKKYQYGIEEHAVITDDGYILNIHRLSGKTCVKNNIIIFLMHGILDSSDSWVLQGPDNALAYILADKGYDVWMGNARGNKYSSEHVRLNRNDSDFWKFSWEEIGAYDIPAMIDHILNTIGKSDLYYVGHSQGTTSFYVLTSLKPEYNAKIKMMFSLAPISWISHAKSPIMKLFTPAYDIFKYFSVTTTIYSSSTEFLQKISKIICNFLPTGCINIMQLIVGNDHKFISESLLPAIYERIFSSGSSTLQFIHYEQLFKSGRFCRFDFGPKENLVKYGQETAPDYDLSHVTVPVVLFYSTNDWLSDMDDVAELFNKLPNVYDSLNMGYFNHFDFMFASVAKDLVYCRIIEYIQDYELNNDDI